MKKLVFVISLIFTSSIVFAQQKFSFAFFTDIHLNNNAKANSFKGLEQAALLAKQQKVDFILTGGDNVDVDAMKEDRLTQAKDLYQRYQDLVKKSGMKWYFTLGNHDRYWHSDGEYGTGLFQNYFGKTYYSFEHKGWKFIILNSAEICDSKYCVSDAQKAWLADVLAETPSSQPIIVSTHVPFLSLYYPVLEGYYTDKDTFKNQQEIRAMFDKHNLKLVLQGHQHLYEEIKVKGVQYITGGAVSANWWSGAFHGTEEGFLKVNLNGDQFHWEYVDYGWKG
ncbi:metallophosphoesterase [Sphingobacterium sp. PU5-4]|uniref:Metallophosphoesterase n=1 Tax=Sphingobacterium tenebrionis TaxID=3111775 RepID=A0ABU8I1U0_9SPHI